MSGEEKPNFSQIALHNFEVAFGKQNVRQTDIGIEITGSILDETLRKRHELLISSCGEYGVHNLHVVPRSSKLIITPDEELNPKLIIPYEGNSIEAISAISEIVAQDADIRRVTNKTGGIRRRILPSDPEYDLERVTGLKWDEIQQSPYGTTVLEPQLSEPVDAHKRRKQEYGIGLAVHDDGKTRLEVENWLGNQTEVEQSRGLNPRTSIPKEWARSENLFRLRSTPKEIIAGIRSVLGTRER